MEVSILDIKSGNMGSLKNILKFIDLKFEIIEDKEKIKNASSLIIPGDGSFNVIDYIKKKDFIDELNSFFLRKKPILGICLGMQLFSNSSEEGKDKEGFGWISGKVRKFSNKLNVKIPHIGYNSIEKKKNHEILDGIRNQSDFYFVHSYYYDIENNEDILATTKHGINFPSIISKKNIIGTQFHPEKSQNNGIKFFQNFKNYIKKITC